MPKATVLPTRELVDSQNMSQSLAVVIDVLRATSSIVQAFSSGSKRVIPAMNRSEALVIKNKYPEALLAGEEEGLKIPGFDLGNSPREYTTQVVRGKTIITTTSNGTKAILGAASQGADPVLICSFLNLWAVKDFIRKSQRSDGKDVYIVCAGSLGDFSLEDFACAGALANELEALGYCLNPDAKEAQRRFIPYGQNILQILEDSHHGQNLKSLGFQDDLTFCANLGSQTVVPVLTKEGLVVSA